MADDRSVRAAADAFQQLGNEFRVAILETLAEAGEPLKFSDLMDALDEPDSGRLNYHLDKLTGTFVAHRNERYELTIQGAKVISSVFASRYVDADATHEVAVDGSCYACDAEDLRLRQTGQRAKIRCDACDRVQFRKSVPLSLWEEREPTTVPDALDRIVRAEFALASNHVCEYCHSATTGRVVETGPAWAPGDAYEVDVLAVYDCDRCTNWKVAPHGLIAWLHPEVRAFHREHGVDPRDVYVWQVDQVRDPEYTTVESTEPAEVAVRFPLGDAECRVTFDGHSQVVRVVRESQSR